MRGAGLLALGLGAALLGCGEARTSTVGTDAGLDAPSDPLTELTAAAAEMSAAVCAKNAACLPVAFERAFVSADDCAKKVVEMFLREALGEGSGATPGTLSQCAQSVKSLECGDLVRWNIERVSPAGCKPHGALELGRPCMYDTQCSSGLCQTNVVGGGGGCGACVNPVADGGKCAFIFDCLPGRHCLLGKCVPAKESGEPCVESVECHFDLACVAGECARLPKVGQPCADDGVCDVDHYERYCDPKDFLCKAVQNGEEGASCGFYPTPHFCKAPSNCAYPQGECTKPPALGEACSPSFGCMQPGVCLEGKCQILDPALCRPPGFPP